MSAFYPSDPVAFTVAAGDLVQIASLAKIGRVRSITGSQADVRLSQHANDLTAPVVTVDVSDLVRNPT